MNPSTESPEVGKEGWERIFRWMARLLGRNLTKVPNIRCRTYHMTIDNEKVDGKESVYINRISQVKREQNAIFNNYLRRLAFNNFGIFHPIPANGLIAWDQEKKFDVAHWFRGTIEEQKRKDPTCSESQVGGSGQTGPVL